MDDKALAAASRETCGNLGNQWEDLFPYFQDILRAAITTYHAALPSDYTEVVELLRLIDNDAGPTNEAITNSAADAIDALMATRGAQSVVFEELGRAHDFIEKRAEAAEAERDKNMDTIMALEDRALDAEGGWREKLEAAEARVAELEGAINRHKPGLETYLRVHAELGEGKNWSEIDNGLRKEEGPCSYNGWQAYMQQRLINALKDIVARAALAQAAQK